MLDKLISGITSSEQYKKVKPKLPGMAYRLFYTDERTTSRQADVIYSKLLYSKKHDISGKPDYIYASRKGEMLLPVELKSGSIGEKLEPREGDLMQLAMYFLIIEDVYKVQPTKGRIIYKDAMFIVWNTKKLRKKVKLVLKDMRAMLKTGDQDANASFPVCRNCICKLTVCEYCDE